MNFATVEDLKIPKVPASYTQLEYIESTGAQWIDTGVSGNTDNLTISVKFNLLSFSSYGGIFGNYKSESENCWRLIQTNTNDNRAYTNANHAAAPSTVVTFEKNVINTFTLAKTEAVVNDASYPLSGNVSGTDNAATIFLFSQNGRAGSNMRLYGCKITDGSVVTRDFVPAKRNSDNTLGLYDTANNVFYTNVGSGTFTAGEKSAGCTVTEIKDASGRVLWSAMTLVASWDVSAAQDGSVIASAYSKLGNADEYSLSIKGTGAMMNWATDATSDFHDSAYKDKITHVTFGDGVTTIGNGAFTNFSNLSGEIVIPESVTSTGNATFGNCSKITKVTFKHTISSVLTLGTSLFGGCSGLTGTFVIPECVTQIPAATFRSCSGITEVIIPASVTQVASMAFQACNSLREITFKHTSADTLGITSGCFRASSVMDTTIYVPNAGNIHTAISGYNWSGSNRNVTYANI